MCCVAFWLVLRKGKDERLKVGLGNGSKPVFYTMNAVALAVGELRWRRTELQTTRRFWMFVWPTCAGSLFAANVLDACNGDNCVCRKQQTVRHGRKGSLIRELLPCRSACVLVRRGWPPDYDRRVGWGFLEPCENRARFS